jgi:hypothetical protein
MSRQTVAGHQEFTLTIHSRPLLVIRNRIGAETGMREMWRKDTSQSSDLSSGIYIEGEMFKKNKSIEQRLNLSRS